MQPVQYFFCLPGVVTQYMSVSSTYLMQRYVYDVGGFRKYFRTNRPWPIYDIVRLINKLGASISVFYYNNLKRVCVWGGRIPPQQLCTDLRSFPDAKPVKFWSKFNGQSYLGRCYDFRSIPVL